MGSQITRSDIIDEFPTIGGSLAEPKAKNVPRTVIAQGALHSWAWDYPTEEARGADSAIWAREAYWYLTIGYINQSGLWHAFEIDLSVNLC